MDFRDGHVVVTGGTGALGRAVVGALLSAGAHCHVPYRQEREKEGLPSGALSLIPVPNLADEAAVAKLYGGLPALWASIHIAGGFAFAPLTDTSGDLLTCSRYFGPRESLEIVPSAGGSNATIAFFGRANRGDPA